eukprot:s5929_g6.t2
MALDVWAREPASGRWQVALELLAGMCREVGGSTIGYNACISVCARGQAWPMAFRLLEVSFNATISASSEGVQWQPALGLFDRMMKERVPHDLVSFNATMDACAMSGEWRPALSLLCAAGAQANLVSFNTALTACHRGSAWEAALALFALLQRRNLQPDTLTYNVMMSVGHKSARWPLALQMLRSLHLSRLAPSDRSAGRAMGVGLGALSGPGWRFGAEVTGGLQRGPERLCEGCAVGERHAPLRELAVLPQTRRGVTELAPVCPGCRRTVGGERSSTTAEAGRGSSACDEPTMTECPRSSWAATGIFDREAALQLPRFSRAGAGRELRAHAGSLPTRRGSSAVPPTVSLALGVPWAVCLGLRKRCGGRPARASITERRVETGGRIPQRKRPQNRPRFGFLQEVRWERFRRRVAALLLAFAVLAAAAGGCMSNSRARLLQSRLEQGGQVEFVYREETPFRQAHLMLSRASLPAVASPSEIPSPWHRGTGFTGFVSDTAHLLRGATVQRSLGAGSTSWPKRSAVRQEQRWRWSP